MKQINLVAMNVQEMNMDEMKNKLEDRVFQMALLIYFALSGYLSIQ